jgi:eukaryotic-like serine/threonine-protein kinase
VIGTKVLHYQILEKLGEGGMGVVYKAHDTKLDRFVALKFLPAHLNASEQDKARFIQEAKAAAALNHPNVCSVIDISEHEGMMFIVMEFVDGQTLREKRSTLSFKQAVEIGIQISEGLAAAHEKGIVHRDIKPDNIMIRKDGIAQIMDFGLAKLRAGGSKINRLTKEGSTVGTAGYMSPEQVQGLDVDHRSDIFSLGVVLYELFTGQLPFRGVHETALAYEIVNVDPQPMASLKPDIDPNLDAIVLECLEKEPRERAQSIAQISVDLKRYKRESSRQRASRITTARPSLAASHSSSPASSAGGGTLKSLLPWIIAAAAIVVAGVFGYQKFSVEETPRTMLRSSIELAQHQSVESYGALALSPDGSVLAYVAADSGSDVRLPGSSSRLWLRSLKSPTAYPIAGTENASFPFWSPDNKFVAFFSNGTLKKVEAGTGSLTTICDADIPSGGSWNREGTIIFTSLNQAGIFRVPAQGGTPVLFGNVDSTHEDIAYSAPCFLPDGNHFLYSINNRLMVVTTDREEGGVYISSLDADERRKILDLSSNALVADGKLLYIRKGNLVTQQLDPGSRQLSGEPATIAELVQYADRYGFGNFSVSQSGLLVYQRKVSSQSGMLVLYDAKGTRLQYIGTAGVYDDPVFSPDGSRLAFTAYRSESDRGEAHADIWINELARGTLTRFTFSPGEEDDPVWTPDGLNIIYSDVGEIVMKPSSGVGEKKVLYGSKRDKVPTDISPDGKYLLYCDFDTKTGRDIWSLPLTDNPTPIPIAVSPFTELSAHYSPDGKWVAYASNETGKLEVYLRSFPSNTVKLQISNGGGATPQWDGSGSALYFIDGTGKMTMVRITYTGTSIHAGSPVPLFQTTFSSPNASPGHIFDVSRDGKRIIMSDERFREGSPQPLDLILHWTEGLKNN